MNGETPRLHETAAAIVAESKGGRLLDRFFAKIDVAETGCWRWTATTSRKNGYGRIGLGGRLVCAHRLSWMLFRGPIPGAMCVLHHCDNPPCVNPSHLFLGTMQDNADDRGAKGRDGNTQGESHPNARLTERDVMEIRSTRGVHGIARRLGVHPSTVVRARNRQTWAHVAVAQG